ncbi:AcrR family transcriptional regulator [Rhodococcus sp. 27YEA15]|uniref:TetR/AcrR family transcriptional regulator n=1 Tax=Rhodococcus sp. 27YEA15 TaxID=3156259 RepID=UPI003C7A4945
MVSTQGFQRARRPEQIEARRCAILDAARALLGSKPVADISLRELSDSIGLAKSNVLRYFDSREAIFLEVLDENWVSWLDAVENAPTAVDSDAPYAAEIQVATQLAESLVERRLLCELVSVMAGVLERNISVDFARDFKSRAVANVDRSAALIRSRIPALSEADARQVASSIMMLVAGLWPHAEPAAAVATVQEEMGSAPAADVFASILRESLINQVVGASVRASLRSGAESGR